MLIGKSNLALTSEHHLQTSSASIAKLWRDEKSGAVESFEQLFKRELQAVPAQLLQVDAAPAEEPAAKASAKSGGPFDAIMEMLFGLPHVPSDAPVLDDPAAADTSGAPRRLAVRGMQMMELTQTTETESCTFAASGNICLADGSTRQFDVGYRMERSEQSTHVGVAAFKDPLVIDFGEPTTALGKQGVEFDIDSDGKTENLRLPTDGSGVLFVDRNHNGKADNGSELFGPQTGNGFGELGQLDGDGNGWIDGGDAAYADLMLWQLSDKGESSYRSLADAGIGALATASAETQFTLKEDGEAVGQVRASSVWLGEKSGAGLVRQIDVASTPRETPATQDA